MGSKVYLQFSSENGRPLVKAQWMFGKAKKVDENGTTNYLVVRRGSMTKAIPVRGNPVYVYYLDEDEIYTNKSMDEFVEYLDQSIVLRKDEKAAWRILEHAFRHGKKVKTKRRENKAQTL